MNMAGVRSSLLQQVSKVSTLLPGSGTARKNGHLRLRWPEMSQLREATDSTPATHLWAPYSANTFPWTNRSKDAEEEGRWKGQEERSEERWRRGRLGAKGVSVTKQ